ncbi:hypothetical protein WDW37_03185 [Bdellovibrionota bacterium FG-1]
MSITPEMPVWYQPEAPLGAAVRHIAGLSSQFNWVGIYLRKGKVMELGFFMGPVPEHVSLETQSELVVLIRDRKEKILGQIKIDGVTPGGFRPEEDQAVRQVAQELGELWPV